MRPHDRCTLSSEQNVVALREPLAQPFDRLELVFLAIFLSFAAVILVLPLHHSIEVFDESYYANAAIEMATHGHWLAPSYHWTTKPPLFLWIVAGLERAGMPPLLAMRLPSEISGLATVVAVYLFCRNVLQRKFMAMAAALLLMSSTAFFGLHVAMSGDMDALLSLCTTLYVLIFFCFAERIKLSTSRAILAAGIALCCAVLTKGVAGVFMLPGLLLYCLLLGYARRIALDRRVWLALASVACITAVCYLVRESSNPSYLRAVWNTELGGRFAQPLESHTGPWNAYLRFLFPPRSIAWLFGLVSLASLLPTPAFTQAGLSPSRSRSAAICLFCAVVVFLLVLSMAKTKLWWYCAPAIPFLSILGALGCANILDWCCVSSPSALRWSKIAVLVLLTCHLYASVRRNAETTSHNEAGEQANYGKALDQLRALRMLSGDTSPVFLIDVGFRNETGPDFDPVADFYTKVATREGMPTTRADWPPQHNGNAWLITCNAETSQVLQRFHLFASSTRTTEGCLFGLAAH